MKQWINGLGLLVLGLAACAKTTESDSNSNWVTSCEEGPECDEDSAASSEDSSAAPGASSAEPETPPGEPDTIVPEPASDAPSEPSSEPNPEPGMTEPGSTEPNPEPAAMPSPVPSEEPDPVSCPAVASSCPEGCAAVTARPLNREGALCFEFMEDTLACAVPGVASTDDDNCVRALDGTLYTGISGSFAGPMIQSGEYEACSEEDEQRISDAIGTCDMELPGESCGSIVCPAGQRCCDSCQNACASPDTDRFCPDDGQPDRSCEAPTEVDAGSSDTAILYSAQLTNPINCCDFYTVIAANPVLDYCAVVEIRHEVGDEPQAQTARAISGANNCWDKLFSNPDAVPETTGPASGLSGTVAYTSESSVQQLDVDLLLNFSDGPAGVPPTVSITFDNLPIDGEWHTAP